MCLTGKHMCLHEEHLRKYFVSKIRLIPTSEQLGRPCLSSDVLVWNKFRCAGNVAWHLLSLNEPQGCLPPGASLQMFLSAGIFYLWGAPSSGVIGFVRFVDISTPSSIRVCF